MDVRSKPGPGLTTAQDDNDNDNDNDESETTMGLLGDIWDGAKSVVKSKAFQVTVGGALTAVCPPAGAGVTAAMMVAGKMVDGKGGAKKQSALATIIKNTKKVAETKGHPSAEPAKRFLQVLATTAKAKKGDKLAKKKLVVLSKAVRKTKPVKVLKPSSIVAKVEQAKGLALPAPSAKKVEKAFKGLPGKAPKKSKVKVLAKFELTSDGRMRKV